MPRASAEEHEPEHEIAYFEISLIPIRSTLSPSSSESAPFTLDKEDVALIHYLRERKEHFDWNVERGVKRAFGPDATARTSARHGSLVIEVAVLSYSALKAFKEVAEMLTWFASSTDATPVEC
jgi:hypothetical protein